MGLIRYRDTRSARLRLTTSEGEVVVVENMQGDQGFRMGFEARRTMDETPGLFRCSVLNLPPDMLDAMESAQVSRVDDLDALLAGKQLQPAVVAEDGSDAIASGFAVVELEAGYDGNVSRIFRAIVGRLTTRSNIKQARNVEGRFQSGSINDDTTQETIIVSDEGLDGAILGLPAMTFGAGAPTFDVVDYLRRIAGLGPGNCDPSTFAAILGDSRLDSPYHCSGGQALTRISEVLKYLDCRWFVDDRELWLCARDGVVSPTGALPWVADGEPEEPEPLIGRPRRGDGGYVEVTCFLCPRIRPGRLVRLTPGGLALAAQGLSPRAAAVQRAQVPPGLYRADEVSHSGSTGPEDFITNMKLRPVVVPDGPSVLSPTDIILGTFMGG